MDSRQIRGFSLLELMIVVVIGFTLASISFIALMPMFTENHIDQAYDLTLSVLRTYRSEAIEQSNRYIITFQPPNTMQVQVWGYAPPPAPSPAPVAVNTYTLPPDMQYAVQAGFPNGPDGFGSGTSAIFFETVAGMASSCAIVASGQPCMIFYPDGSVQDDQGNTINGVIYITRPTSNVYSSRAIDFWGTTGRLRGWRLYSKSGTNTWVQQ
jgi:type II secretory pathway pseudopilin PulG